jgi:hypothetical protein
MLSFPWKSKSDDKHRAGKAPALSALLVAKFPSVEVEASWESALGCSWLFLRFVL